uniref:Uncharacterized protein n=1 Tax=viral metagenome TaxID=1070528 RepID=A0A6M3L2X2_9ZZZZ
MIITLDNLTHPEVEILTIDLEHKSVTFRNRDGVCSAPMLEYKTDIPIKEDLKVSIEAVLFEAITVGGL